MNLNSMGSKLNFRAIHQIPKNIYDKAREGKEYHIQVSKALRNTVNDPAMGTLNVAFKPSSSDPNTTLIYTDTKTGDLTRLAQETEFRNTQGFAQGWR